MHPQVIKLEDEYTITLLVEHCVGRDYKGEKRRGALSWQPPQYGIRLLTGQIPKCGRREAPWGGFDVTARRERQIHCDVCQIGVQIDATRSWDLWIWCGECMRLGP